MKVSEIMSTPVTTVKPETSFKAALELLVDQQVSGLPVVDGDGRIVGIVTEADLINKEAYQRSRRRALDVVAELVGGGTPRWYKSYASTVAEVMTRRPLVATPDEDVRVVARRMVENEVKRLPVVDVAGHVVGIVSRRDVLSIFNRPDAEIASDLRTRYDSPRWAPEDAEVELEVDDGVVTLRGSVLHPADRQVMEGVAWSVPGVVAVVDELDWREPDPPSRYRA